MKFKENQWNSLKIQSGHGHKIDLLDRRGLFFEPAHEIIRSLGGPGAKHGTSTPNCINPIYTCINHKI